MYAKRFSLDRFGGCLKFNLTDYDISSTRQFWIRKTYFMLSVIGLQKDMFGS